MRSARTAVVALVLGAAATVAAPVPALAAPVTVFGLRAPEEISGFSLNDSTNFERIKPGDGYGLDYSQSGWKLDVFIYDLKRAAIPDDARSAIVRAEFERARADAFLAQPSGIYAQVYLRRNFTIDDAARRTRFQCAQFHLTRDGAKPQDGFLCVTAWNNKFVKLRLTTLADPNSEGSARRFVSAWIPVLWGGGRPETARASPKPEPDPEVVEPPASRSSSRNSRPTRAAAPSEPDPEVEAPPPRPNRAARPARAEAPRPAARPAPPPPRRPAPSRSRKPPCPENFICEYR